MTELVTLREQATKAPLGTRAPCAVRTDSLNAYFGAVHAVRDVSLDVPTNEVTAIIGP